MKIDISEIICIIFVSVFLGFGIGLEFCDHELTDYFLEHNLAHYNPKTGDFVKDSLNFRNDTIFIIRKEN